MLFRTARVAVFIDGCYWHGCPEHGSIPRSNTEWWIDKLERNRARDRDTDDRLRSQGWSSLRFWEHESPEVVADVIERTVRRRIRDR